MKELSQVASKDAYSLLAETVRMRGGVRLPAVGTSMVPAIQPGDVLTIQSVEPQKVSPGDIVVYKRERMLVVHRIVRTCVSLSEQYLVTRGDRMLRNDAPVLADELLGRVACIERKNRRVNLRSVSNWAEQALCVVWRRSDRATYLFLRAKEWWNGLFSKGNVWQA